jgi:hypothetical protein
MKQETKRKVKSESRRSKDSNPTFVMLPDNLKKQFKIKCIQSGVTFREGLINAIEVAIREDLL